MQSKDLLGLQMNSVIMNSFRPENGCYVCSVCQSSYTNKGNFRQHMEKHFKNEEFTAGSAGPDLSNGKQNGLGESPFSLHCFNWPDIFLQMRAPTCTNVMCATPPTATRVTSSSTY